MSFTNARYLVFYFLPLSLSLFYLLILAFHYYYYIINRCT